MQTGEVVYDACSGKLAGRVVGSEGADGPMGSGIRLEPPIQLGESFTVSMCVLPPRLEELKDHRVLAAAKSSSGRDGLLLLSIYDFGLGVFLAEDSPAGSAGHGGMLTAPNTWSPAHVATGTGRAAVDRWLQLVARGERGNVSLAIDGRGPVLFAEGWGGSDLGRLAGDWEAQRPQGFGGHRVRGVRVFGGAAVDGDALATC